jgi:hypothetical protein
MCKRKPISPRRRQMPRTNPISPARGRVTEAKYAKRTQFRATGWRPDGESCETNPISPERPGMGADWWAATSRRSAIVQNEPNFAPPAEDVGRGRPTPHRVGGRLCEEPKRVGGSGVSAHVKLWDGQGGVRSTPYRLSPRPGAGRRRAFMPGMGLRCSRDMRIRNTVRLRLCFGTGNGTLEPGITPVTS